MESAHDELDPCQHQQAVNSLLFSLWWCTMQPAIVVKFLGRQNLLYSWFCYYFYPLRKIERCRSSPLWFARTPWWLHEKTNSHTQTKRPAMLMSKTCLTLQTFSSPCWSFPFLLWLYVWLSSDVMRRNVRILVTQHFYSFSHRKEETDCFGRKQQVRKKKYM